MLNILGNEKGRGKLTSDRKGLDMPYGDSDLLSLFIILFQCLDLKHYL